MHTYACAPPAGNLLVRVDATHGPVPVLLDFGLTKRLPHAQKLAFCRLVVCLSLLDTDGVVEALQGLGVEFAAELDPWALLRGLAFTFRDTENDAQKARARITRRIKSFRAEREERKRREREREEREHKKKDATPPRSLPGVVAYFYRTLCAPATIERPMPPTRSGHWRPGGIVGGRGALWAVWGGAVDEARSDGRGTVDEARSDGRGTVDEARSDGPSAHRLTPHIG